MLDKALSIGEKLFEGSKKIVCLLFIEVMAAVMFPDSIRGLISYISYILPRIALEYVENIILQPQEVIKLFVALAPLTLISIMVSMVTSMVELECASVFESISNLFFSIISVLFLIMLICNALYQKPFNIWMIQQNNPADMVYLVMLVFFLFVSKVFNPLYSKLQEIREDWSMPLHIKIIFISFILVIPLFVGMTIIFLI